MAPSSKGGDLKAVLAGEDGVAVALVPLAVAGSVGMSRDDLARIVVEYRREIWLWLAGERTWAQCCSGLIGRIARRIESPRG